MLAQSLIIEAEQRKNGDKNAYAHAYVLMLMSRLFSLARKNLVLVFVFVLVSLVGTRLKRTLLF